MWGLAGFLFASFCVAILLTSGQVAATAASLVSMSKAQVLRGLLTPKDKMKPIIIKLTDILCVLGDEHL